MSNFVSETKHPQTGRVEIAEWLDDYYGRHQYGVRFQDGKVFHEDVISGRMTIWTNTHPHPGARDE